MFWKSAIACLAIILFHTGITEAEDVVADAIQAIRSVQPPSRGSADARSAMKQLIDAGDSSLLPILKGFRDASPLATNWLRNAFDSIAGDVQAGGRRLPEEELVAFIRSESESPIARRLAYEWLLREKPELKQELIPGMLLDPSPEFRRDAVAMLIETAGAREDAAAAVDLYRQALSGAVHKDQVDTIAKALRKGGEEIDIRRHFGFLSEWKVIGPFDNKEEKGFPVAYPPESELNFDAEYDGQLGKVQWQSLATQDDYGVVDIGKQIQNYKGSVMYAATSYQSADAKSVELRLGTPNAWKLWVNGELAFEREEYHRSTQMDQYRIPIQLTAGANTILLKVCQNEQTQDWAQDYHFQLRVCDATGAAVLPTVAAARREPTSKGTN